MKKILFCLILLLSFNVTYAEDLPISDKNITLISETAHISPTRDQKGEFKSIKINSSFVFKNNGPKTSVQMSYPDGFLPESDKSMISDFTVNLKGSALAINKTPPYEKEVAPDIIRTVPGNFIWNLDFNDRETKTIDIKYEETPQMWWGELVLGYYVKAVHWWPSNKNTVDINVHDLNPQYINTGFATRGYAIKNGSFGWHLKNVGSYESITVQYSLNAEKRMNEFLRLCKKYPGLKDSERGKFYVAWTYLTLDRDKAMALFNTIIKEYPNSDYLGDIYIVSDLENGREKSLNSYKKLRDNSNDIKKSIYAYRQMEDIFINRWNENDQSREVENYEWLVSYYKKNGNVEIKTSSDEVEQLDPWYKIESDHIEGFVRSAINRIGDAYKRSYYPKDYEKAINAYERSQEMFPEQSAITLYEKGQLYEKMGQIDKAKSEYSQAISLSEEYLKTANNELYRDFSVIALQRLSK